jgi:outer membrane protein assembly factor BamB
MTSQQSLERLVAGWMADEAGTPGDVEFIDRMVETTRRQRPRPRWLALVVEAPMRGQARLVVGSPTRRLAFAATLVVLALLGALAVGAFLLQRQALLDGWAGFRGGPGHDGAASVGLVGNPVARWTAHLGAPVKNNIAVMGEFAFVSTEDGILHALRIDDGIEQWTFEAGTSLTGPVASKDLVYVTDGRGILHALDVTTGSLRWSATHPVFSASAGTIDGGAIFVGTADGRVVAFDVQSGALRWDVAVSPTPDVVGSPAAGSGLVYAASRSGGLVALRPETGDLAWRFDTGDVQPGTVVHADGVTYVGSAPEAAGGPLRAIDSAGGQLRWSVDEPLFSPSVKGSLAISSSESGVISARDVVSGMERWRLEAPGITRPAAIAGGIAFIAADADRQILAVDLATGRVAWRLAVDGENQCCLAVAGGLVFAGTMNGTVYAIGGDGEHIVPPISSSAGTPTPLPTATAAGSPIPDPLRVVRRIDPADLGLEQVLGLVVSPSGDIYLTDLSDHVTRLDAAGTVIGSWGGSGSGEGQFDFTPASTSENVHGSIGVGPDGSVYVSDSDNHRVQVFNATGGFIRQFGAIGTLPGQFALAFDLTADASGNVYVLDDGLPRLTKFSPAGEPLWTADGSIDAVLAGHNHGATLDTLGRLVLVNDDHGSVMYVNADGRVVESFNGRGCDVAVDRNGNVVVSDCGNGPTQVFDAGHRLIGSSDISLKLLRFGPGEQVVGIGSDGAILFLALTLPPS